MKTSDKITNKKSSDPIDILIFEKGIRLKHLFIDKELDLIIVLLNNGSVLKTRISDFPRLKKAKKNQLDKWKIVGKGISVEWEDLNEDLSVKGLINNAVLQTTLKNLEGKKMPDFVQ